MNKIEKFIDYVLHYIKTNHHPQDKRIYKTTHNLTRYDITFEEIREHYLTLDYKISQTYSLYRINFRIDMNNDVLLIIEIGKED